MKRLLVSVLTCVFTLGIQAQNIDTNEDNQVVEAIVDSINNVSEPEQIVQNVIVVEKTVRFGYLSYNAVIQQMSEYSEAMSTIAQLRVAYEEELRRGEENFTKLFSEYIDGQQSFPENILLKRQKELQQSMDESIQFKQEARALLEKREREVMDKLHNKLAGVLKQIGTERRYAFIINTDGDIYPFVNPEMGEDLTQEVMFRLRGGME